MRENLNDARRTHELLRVAKQPAGQGKVQAFITIDVSSKPDYLRCRTWDGTNQGATVIAVARPPLLQQSRFDGFLLDGFAYDYDGPNLRNKTRESDGKLETQVIVPAYRNETGSDLHQIIYAQRAWTGLVESDDVGPIDDATIVWVDLNVDGRAWAKRA